MHKSKKPFLLTLSQWLCKTIKINAVSDDKRMTNCETIQEQKTSKYVIIFGWGEKLSIPFTQFPIIIVHSLFPLFIHLVLWSLFIKRLNLLRIFYFAKISHTNDVVFCSSSKWNICFGISKECLNRQFSRLYLFDRLKLIAFLLSVRLARLSLQHERAILVSRSIW